MTGFREDVDLLLARDDADRRRARARLVLVVLACTIALATPARAETLPPAVALVDEQTNAGGFVEDGEQLPKQKLPPANERNQLRLELGIGAPSGMIAVRYSRVLSTRTRIEPAVGLGYTGVLGSLLVTHPLFEAVVHTKQGTATGVTFELYGGYSASYLNDELHHPWTGREQFIPNGTYHWIDLGLSTQVRWRALRLTAGGGVTKLLAGPEGIGGDNADDETFWYFFPEGWFSRKQLAPAVWSSIGFAF